jgi:hypothetical protein
MADQTPEGRTASRSLALGIALGRALERLEDGDTVTGVQVSDDDEAYHELEGSGVLYVYVEASGVVYLRLAPSERRSSRLLRRYRICGTAFSGRAAALRPMDTSLPHPSYTMMENGWWPVSRSCFRALDAPTPLT